MTIDDLNVFTAASANVIADGPLSTGAPARSGSLSGVSFDMSIRPVSTLGVARGSLNDGTLGFFRVAVPMLGARHGGLAANRLDLSLVE